MSLGSAVLSAFHRRVKPWALENGCILVIAALIAHTLALYDDPGHAVGARARALVRLSA